MLCDKVSIQQVWEGLVEHQTQAGAVWEGRGGEGRGGEGKGGCMLPVGNPQRASALTTAVIQQAVHQHRWLGRFKELVKTGKKR